MTSLLLLKSLLFAKALRKKRKTMDATSGVKLNLKKCRVCLVEEGDMPIFDNVVHPKIPGEIEHFTSISIKKSDKLSKVICQSCFDLLNGCILFRDMCQNNHKKMLNFLKLKECEEVKVSIKEEVYDDCDENIEEPEDNEMPIKSDSDDSLPLKPECRRAAFTCPRCNLECKESKAYKIHAAKCIENESKDGIKKTFLCDTCGKTSKSRASLLTHMAIHENIFPFKCDACPYQGRTMDLLKVHKRSHLVEKPYKCTQCPKATTTSSNLNKHMRHVHSTTRPFKCSYCDKAFSYQHDMKRHIKDIHLRQGTVECDICYKSFNTKKILQGHRWKIHKIKGERHGRLPSYLQCQPGMPSKNPLIDPTETDICDVLANENGSTE